jgi:hypothetical protein
LLQKASLFRITLVAGVPTCCLCEKLLSYGAPTSVLKEILLRASSTSRFSLSGQSISRAHRRIAHTAGMCVRRASLFRHTYLSVAHTSPTQQRQVSSIVRDLGCSAHISCKSYAKEAKNLILSQYMCARDTQRTDTRIHNGMIILFTPHIQARAQARCKRAKISIK